MFFINYIIMDQNNNNMINDDDIKKLSKKMVDNINLFDDIIAPQMFQEMNNTIYHNHDILCYSFPERLGYYYCYPNFFFKKLISLDDFETKLIFFCIIYIFYSYYIILSNIV